MLSYVGKLPRLLLTKVPRGTIVVVAKQSMKKKLRSKSLTTRYESLLAYCKDTGAKKVWLATNLGVSRFQMAGLLYPDRYPVVLHDQLVRRLAVLLNQPSEYVRKLYARAA